MRVRSRLYDSLIRRHILTLTLMRLVSFYLDSRLISSDENSCIDIL